MVVAISPHEDPTPHTQVVICTPGLPRPPKEEKVMLKIGCRDQYPRAQQWTEIGVSGLSESQDKLVGALAGLSRVSLPWTCFHWKLCRTLLGNRVLGCIVRLR